jgi:ribonuclease HI
MPNPDKEYQYAWYTTTCPLLPLANITHTLLHWLQPHDSVEDTTYTTPLPETPTAIATDISTAMKTDVSRVHLTLLRNLQKNPKNVITYMDGSQLATATGAGYTIPIGLPTTITAVVPMGNTVEVFNAELRVIHECLLTCLKYIRLHHQHHHHIHIFTDNQAAIRRSAGLHRGPGQEMAHYIYDTVLKLCLYAATITVHWVPGYTEIPGTEAADALAKLGTTMQPL